MPIENVSPYITSCGATIVYPALAVPAIARTVSKTNNFFIIILLPENVSRNPFSAKPSHELSRSTPPLTNKNLDVSQLSWAGTRQIGSFCAPIVDQYGQVIRTDTHLLATKTLRLMIDVCTGIKVGFGTIEAPVVDQYSKVIGANSHLLATETLLIGIGVTIAVVRSAPAVGRAKSEEVGFLI
jgi:hypothetical protein